MKQRRRFGIIFGGLSIIVFVVGMLCLRSLSLGGDERRVAAFAKFQHSGITLKASELTTGQRIEITRIRDGHGVDLVCTFILSCGPSVQLLAIKRAVIYEKNWGPVPGEHLGTAFCEITADQRRDIDVLIRLLRTKAAPFSPYYDTYEIDCFSGDRKIGSEKMVDYLRLHSFYRGYSYDELPVEIRAGITIGDWKTLQTASALLNDLEVQAAGNSESKQATSLH
jgi:hypothetical protein